MLRNYTHDRYGRREIAVNITEDVDGSASESSTSGQVFIDKVHTQRLIGHIEGDSQQIELTEKRTADHDHESSEDVEIDDADAVTNRKIIIEGKRRTSFHEGKLSRMRSETMRADRCSHLPKKCRC